MSKHLLSNGVHSSYRKHWPLHKWLEATVQTFTSMFDCFHCLSNVETDVQLKSISQLVINTSILINNIYAI